jgi:hypothetical protein
MNRPTSIRTKNWLGVPLRSVAVLAGLGAAGMLCQFSASAASVTWNFDTDPTLSTDPHPIKVSQGQAFAYKDSTGNSVYWKGTGGSPATGGFLGVCWPLGSASTIVVFPDIDQGKLVTAFKLDTDLRVGSPQQSDRAADGFSINFARSDDPAIANPVPESFATSGAVETGTKTGLAISFDTWSGNTLPDGNDIEGIIVRVDNVTVLRHDMPTRNGICSDATSLQTGPRNADYWTWAKANGFNQDPGATDLTATPPISPDLAFAPDSWTNLCWQHLSVELDNSSKLTVIWKGVTVLDHYQTTFFPSPGAIILAGRTGGADEHTHFDNLTLSTTAVSSDTTPPTLPANFKTIAPVGSARVALTWDPSTDASGRVAYEIARGDTVLGTTLTTNFFLDFPPNAGTNYAYTVRAKDVSLNYTAYVTNVVNVPAEVQVAGTVKVQLWDNIGGTDVDSFRYSTLYPYPSRGSYTLGLSAGSVNGTAGWNESFGDNLGLRMTGVLIVPETGSYDFFIRSDDSSMFFLNTTGASLPDELTGAPLVQEGGCCHAFLEPNDAGNTGMTTTNAVALTAGQQYGFVVLMKEGGGGDGVAVGMRKAGDTTPAANVPAIGGPLVKAAGDPIGSTLDILTQPAPVAVIANEKATFSVTVTNSSMYDSKIWPSTAWYQWLKNGKPVLGAVSSTWTIPAAAIADNNAQISVAVGSEGLATTSSVVALTVSADTKKPTVASAIQTDIGFTTVKVTFSEPVTAPTATTAGNYTLSGGATVSAAALSADGFSVTLTTSKLNASTAYTLTVNNVTDIGGNTIASSSQVALNSWIQVLGTVKVEKWDNINGTTVDLLQADPRFPNTPDSNFTTNSLIIGSASSLTGWNDSYGDNYGMRITGTLTPPGTGQWNFFIRSDDSSAFYLNTTGPAIPDAYATNTPVAYEPGCCNGFLEPGNNQTTKTPITLTLGQQYGFTVLLKEGGGGDGVAVGMRMVGDTTAALDVPGIVQYMPKVTVQTPPAGTTIKWTVTGNQIKLEWTGGGTLQSTTTLGSTWNDVSGASTGYTVPATGTAAFYRVKQ